MRPIPVEIVGGPRDGEIIPVQPNQGQILRFPIHTDNFRSLNGASEAPEDLTFEVATFFIQKRSDGSRCIYWNEPV